MATPYHRLARETPEYGWWKLPVAGIGGAVGYLAVTVVLVLWAVVGFAATGDRDLDSLDQWIQADALLDLDRPELFVLTMLSIAVLLPVVLVSVLVTGPRPIGYLTSVEGRMRWRWLACTAAVAFVVYGLVIVGSLLVTDEPVSSPALDGRAVVALVLVAVFTPFQAAAEEYVFRGYLLQLVGSWTRFAFVPVLVSVPLFTAGHTYELWGLVDVAIFGLTAAYLVIRTGGLEAAIAAHVANNVVLLALEALGVFVSTDEGAGPVDLVPTIVASLLMVGLVEVLVRRLGIVRTREPIPPPPPPAPMWPPPPYVVQPAPWPPPPGWGR